MEYRGVVYDVGLRFTVGNPYSVENFDMDLVTYDIDTIATELQCNAIRVEGEEIERLVAAARIAHLAGLIIFFNPWKMNIPITELPVYFAQAARAAEQLRIEGADIIFVAGCEISLFNEGIFAGSTVIDRITHAATQNLPRSAPPRTIAASCRPNRCSITGCHGTRRNPLPSSNIA